MHEISTTKKHKDNSSSKNNGANISIATNLSASNRREEPFQNQFEEAVGLHQKGVEGDKKAVIAAHEHFQALLGQTTFNNLVSAYLGSSTALLGRDAIDPSVRFEKALKGLKMLDNAVANEPENTDIRTLRAYVCYRLPEAYFHRTNTAIEDLRFLIAQFDNDQNLFTPQFYWRLLYDLGMCYKNLERLQTAKEVWFKLLQVCKDDTYEDLLRSEGVILPGHRKKKGRSEEIEAILVEAKKQHALACLGSKGDLQKVLEFFEQAVASAPSNPLLEAYYADCKSINGREAANSSEMFANAIMAMIQLDQAVKSAPNNPQVRLIRAYQSFRLPESFFHRTATAIGDFENLASRYEQDPNLFSQGTYWQTLFDLGTAYRRIGLETEARDTWQRLLAAGPSVDYAKRVASQLEEETIQPISADGPQAMQEGFRLHDLAVAGKKAATQMALEYWKKLSTTEPQNIIAKGYYASCIALSGRDANDPSQIFTNTITGIKLLNRAVNHDLHNVRLRLLRAYLLYSLPPVFFPPSETTLKDFRFLKFAYQKDPGVFSKECYQQLLYDLGVVYEKKGASDKAQKVWKELRQSEPNVALLELLIGKDGIKP